jgi:hypothetical protein
MKLSALLLPVAAAAMLISTNCATISPPQPPSLDLPKPPQDLRAARKGNRVTLTWTVPGITTDRQAIRVVGPTRICRSTVTPMQDCGNAVAQVAPTAGATAKSSENKISASFTDTLPGKMGNFDASGFICYAVEVLNPANRGAGLSNEVRVLSAPTLPPPQYFQARVTTQGIVLSWTKTAAPGHIAQNVSFIIRVYRHEEGSQQETVLGETPIDGDPVLTDSNIEWEKTYEYRADSVTLVESGGTEAQVEGDDTPEIKVLAHDVFPPAVPSGLQAVFSGPGQSAFIDLIWAPVTDPDLAGYNVYRHEGGTQPVKLNSDPLTTPAYRDTQVSPGKRYFYSVTSIDIRGNESSKSEEASEIVP